MPKAIDMTGKKFGHWTVIKKGGTASNRGVTWLCKCECGNERTVVGIALRDGTTKSCGCRKEETENKGSTTHGKSKSPEWKAWNNIIQRCTNKNSPAYKNYGGRGISICKRWLNSFDSFYADMGKRPGATYSIDRTNNNGNYEPSNCRWVTEKEQQNNRRNNKR